MDDAIKEGENSISQNMNKTNENEINKNISIENDTKDKNNDIEIERDKSRKKDKYLSINRKNPYSYSKSPFHTNNKLNNRIQNMGKINKPFLTSKYNLINKYSLKEVNECVYKDYTQIANILPYYQNYYFQNRLNNYYNYKNNNININPSNDAVLICLKYIEYSNFFFNSDITYKIQNLLFNIINGDRGILDQNKYTFLKNRLKEVYNKLIPFQIRYNYLKAFYGRNPEETLYHLFKRDLDKINISKSIGIKNLNYLYEIFEIVQQKMGAKKEYIQMIFNKLYNNKNGGYYNNNLMNVNNINLNQFHNSAYNQRKQSFNQNTPNNSNYNNLKDLEINHFKINNSSEHNFKGSYPTRHNNSNYYFKNRNNSYIKQELVELDESKNKLNIENDNSLNNNNINSDEYMNFINQNNIKNIVNINDNNNGNIFWNNLNMNNINMNPLKNYNNNNLIANNIYDKINNVHININGNILQNNLNLNNNNNNINQNNTKKQMKINLPLKKEGENEIKLNKEPDDNKINNALDDIDFLYNTEDNKNKEKKSNSANSLPKIIFNENNNDVNINNNKTKNISLNNQELNLVLKQMILTQSYLTSNINKYISQYTLFHQNNDLYLTYILAIYNQGILNNISFLNQNGYNNQKNNYLYNNHNNKINILKQEKIIITEYEQLNKMKKENPSQISDNLKLFENYILLPIYNEINSNSNTPEISKLYSNVYSKYKEVINSVIQENNLEGTIVEPYGSIVNNFLTSDGDIDISIVPNNISKIGFRIYLEQIEKELIKNNLIQDNDEVNDINMNTNNRIYISTRYARLSVIDLESNINIDITVHNLLPIKNSKMIRLYSLFDQRFHILGIFLKHWVKINNIKGAPNKFLSSYALLLLVIHFLQDVVEPKILPMLQEIISKDKNKKDFDYKYFYDDKEFNTNLYFEENFDNMKEYMNIINCGNENESSVAELLVQFFEYYAYIYNNNTKHYLISVKHSDKNFIANNTEHIAYPLEDPFDVNHNPSNTLKLNTPQYSEFIFCMKKEINNILSGEYFK